MSGTLMGNQVTFCLIVESIGVLTRKHLNQLSEVSIIFEIAIAKVGGDVMNLFFSFELKFKKSRFLLFAGVL